MMSRAAAVATLTTALAGHAAGQSSCSYTGPLGTIDYSGLADTTQDYSVESSYYQNYEFLTNVCTQLYWVNGDCAYGSQFCERLKSTMSATDVYGKANTAVFMTDSSATYFDDATPYISMTGENCMFGSTYMTARVYLVCDSSVTTPTITIVHESYYDCQVYVKIVTSKACSGGGGGSTTDNPSTEPQKGGAGDDGKTEKTDVGMFLCIFFFVFLIGYFVIGAVYLHKKGERGFDRVPQKEFWTSLPGLVKDGLAFTGTKISEAIAKWQGKESNYTELH